MSNAHCVAFRLELHKFFTAFDTICTSMIALVLPSYLSWNMLENLEQLTPTIMVSRVAVCGAAREWQHNEFRILHARSKDPIRCSPLFGFASCNVDTPMMI